MTDRTPVLSVAFHTLGCKVNRAESEDIAAELMGRGVRLTSESEASVVVINTCTVTGEADTKARKAVRRILSAENAPIVVVTGCLAATDDGSLSALGERVVVEADKERVADRVAELLRAGGGKTAPFVRVGQGFRTRAMLKVEDGCDVFCAYCIVPHARGGPRSVPIDIAVEEAARLVSSGAREIVLTGINIGRYRDGDADIAELVRAVGRSGVARIRISSIEPVDLSDRFLGALAEVPALCGHLHVPLQSGSDEVLRAMRRSYTIAEYEERIAAVRDAIPGVTITTDVMAGFPGETDEQALETLKACLRIGFGKLHVFRYSERPGTPAAEMTQVPPAVRACRAAELRKLGERLRGDFIDSRLGSTSEVLVERLTGDGVAEGTTSDYLKVRFTADPATDVGSLRLVTLTERQGESVLGRLGAAQA